MAKLVFILIRDCGDLGPELKLSVRQSVYFRLAFEVGLSQLTLVGGSVVVVERKRKKVGHGISSSVVGEKTRVAVEERSLDPRAATLAHHTMHFNTGEWTGHFTARS
jgi:hypothetical protein